MSVSMTAFDMATLQRSSPSELCVHFLFPPAFTSLTNRISCDATIDRLLKKTHAIYVTRMFISSLTTAYSGLSSESEESHETYRTTAMFH